MINNMEDVCNNGSKEEYLKSIKLAAERKSPELLIELLFQSGEVGRISRLLKVRWDRIPDDEVEYALSEALYVLFVNVKHKKKIGNPQAFIWKISYRKIADCYRRMKHEVPLPIEKLVVLSNKKPQVLEDTKEDTVPEQSLEEAINITRSMIPYLGNKNIQNVMTHILKELERGGEDLSNKSIAEAVGLRVGTARVYKFRAFKKLAKHIDLMKTNLTDKRSAGGDYVCT